MHIKTGIRNCSQNAPISQSKIMKMVSKFDKFKKDTLISDLDLRHILSK